MQQLQSQEPFGIQLILRNLHRKEIGIGLRVFLSLIATCFIVGLALLWLWCTEFSAAGFYISDSEVWRASLIAFLPWLGCQLFIWHGLLGWNKVPRRLILVTVGILAVTAALCISLDEFMGVSDTDYAVTGMWLIGLAIAACAWFAELVRRCVGNPIVDTEDNVRVFCPECGYSLIGLRECRCPECGEVFTLDEIIRRQDYGAIVRQALPKG